MNSQIDQIKSIFLDAIEKHAPDQWEAFLDDACLGNEKLRNDVLSLLEGHARGASLIDNRHVETLNDVEQDESVGTQIGPYKLLESIGEGGMGTVYMAEQTEPVKRRVALKLIKTGMDTKQVIARFEAERQTLALMDHPNIAKVLDAGATDSGRPYFVMELVKGVAINKFCDERHLDPKQRLDLFIQVCHAVQHAHQKGIIHRDLKPSNIMVALYDDIPVPKVIDFGVAKATGEQLTKKTMFTRFGQVLGTLEYMSPEQTQLNQLDVDTRSDIYSLGAILYELLSGSPPFEASTFKTAALDEVFRIIREDEPSKPSTKASTAESLSKIATDRKTQPQKLSALLQGDLDWIVMKALDKERSRRYETASGFASDIERYLKDEPVSAGPPSAAYRFRKFARRNSGILLAGSIIAALLVVGTGVSTWQAIRAQAEAREAERQTAIANAVQNFWNNHVLLKASPIYQPNPNITLREVLENASKEAKTNPVDEPLAAAEIHRAIANTYMGLSDWEKVLSHSRDELSLLKKRLGQNHFRVLRAQMRIAGALNATGNHVEATRLIEETITSCKEFLGDDHLVTRNSVEILARVYRKDGRYEEAIKILEDQLSYYQTHKHSGDPQDEYYHKQDGISSGALQVMMDLGSCYSHLGKNEQALEIHETALTVVLDLYPVNHPATIKCHFDVGIVNAWLGRNSEAEPHLREALQLSRRVYRIDSPKTNRYAHNLSHCLYLQRKFDQDIELWESLLQSHPTNAEFRTKLAGAVHNKGESAIGLTLERRLESNQEAIDMLEGVLDEHPDHNRAREYALVCYEFHALQLHLGGVFDRSATGWQRVIAVRENMLTDNPTDINNLIMLGDARCNRGLDLNSLKDYDGAVAEFQKAETNLKRACKLDAANDLAEKSLRKSMESFAITLRDNGRFTESLDKWDELIALAGDVDSNLFEIRKCETRARAGDHREASKTVAEMIEGELSGTRHWPDMASVYSSCSQAVMNDNTLSEDARLEVRNDYKDRAMMILNRAKDDLSEEQLKFVTDTRNLEALRDRKDFVDLVERWKTDAESKTRTSVAQEGNDETEEDGRVNPDDPKPG